MDRPYWKKGNKNSEYVRCDCCYNGNRLKADIHTNLHIRGEYPRHGKYINTLIHLYNGIIFNNKICCILHFCKLSFRGLRPAIISGYMRGESHKWYNAKLTEDELTYINSHKG